MTAIYEAGSFVIAWFALASPDAMPELSHNALIILGDEESKELLKDLGQLRLVFKG